MKVENLALPLILLFFKKIRTRLWDCVGFALVTLFCAYKL